MKISSKIGCIALLLVCSMLFGCSGVSIKGAAQEPADVQIAEITTPMPQPTAAPVSASSDPAFVFMAETQPPTATAAPVTDAAEIAAELAALDLAVFTDYVTSNGYVLQSSLVDPSDFGIDETASMQTWGDFTQEAAEKKGAWAEECLAELAKIDREQLVEKDQLSYDTLETYLQRIVASAGMFVYQDPLLPKDGIHAELPLLLSRYRLETAEDIESYLLLMSDTPRYFAELLAQQQLRADRGLFMTEDALETVLSECAKIIDNEKDLYVKDVFEKAIGEIDALSRADRNAYIERHDAMIRDALIPAYVSLRDGLQALSERCRAEGGMYASGSMAAEYYAYKLSEEAASDISPEDALSLLDTTMQDLSATMQMIYADMPSAADAAKKLTGKTTALKLIGELQTYTERILPKNWDDLTVTIREVPKKLSDIISVSSCFAPPIDAKSNVYEILVNPNDTGSLLLTLAHESWPGHLYQYTHQREIAGLGLLQKAMPLEGYYEGWAAMAEEWLLLEQTKYDQNAAMFAFCNSMLSDAILPSIVSILVNYYGYERDDIRDHLGQYGLNQDEYVDLYFEYAVTRPYSALSYGIGYAQLAQMMRDMSGVLGVNYLQKDVQIRYLDFGPSYFHLVRERMDEWADTKMPE